MYKTHKNMFMQVKIAKTEEDLNKFLKECYTDEFENFIYNSFSNFLLEIVPISVEKGVWFVVKYIYKESVKGK